MDKKKVKTLVATMDNILKSQVFTSTTAITEIEKVFIDLKEALVPEPRLYVGRQVLVSQDGKIWKDIRMSETAARVWLHIKPHPDAVSLPNWIEHDGSDIRVNCSSHEFIVGIYSSTGEHYISGKDGNKLHLLGMSRYCIIPLPQFID